MSHPTPSTQAPDATKSASLLARYHDLLPIFFLAMMAVGFLMYWAPAGTTVPAWQSILGKKVLVPYANLFLLLYIVFSKALPGLQQNLIKRHEETKEGIVSFEERNDVIAQQYREVREKLAGVDDESASLLERAKKHSNEEKEKQIALAEAQAARTLSDTENTLSQESRRLQQDLKKDLIEASFALATKRLEAEFKDADQLRLQKDYLQQLEKSA